MKKMNNKGFAITTIVYGLSIMGILLIAIIMGIISSNRTHNRELSSQIVEDLIRYSKTSTSFTVSESGGQLYTVPKNESGWYKIELWGAQGGGVKGGLGAYTSGIIELNEGDDLYFYVGKHKNTGEGGEESDVRIISGAYDDVNSYSTRIMVAAGGGADEDADGGTLFGYTADIKAYGGQYDENFNLLPPGPVGTTKYTTNGTLVGYLLHEKNGRINNKFVTSKIVGQNPTGFGYFNNFSSPRAEFNGGDGYFASHDFGKNQYGYSFSYGGSDSGGTSYISGYGGCRNIEKKYTMNNGYYSQQVRTVGDSVYIHYDRVYNEETGEHEEQAGSERQYIFYDGMMFPGVNKGDGKARITKIMNKTEDVQTLPRHNAKLNDIKYIVLCIKDEGYGSYSSTMTVMANGKDYINSRYSTGVNVHLRTIVKDDERCDKYTLAGEATGVDEIAIWPKDDYVDFKNLRITVGGENDPKCSGQDHLDDECSIVIKDRSATEVSETKTFTGIRFSSYQFDATKPLPDVGNYMIQPVLYENMVMTAPATVETEQNPVVVDYVKGDINQQWAVEKVQDSQYGENIYKIVDLARFKALSILNDENKLGNKVVANREFNSNAIDETQLWKITPMGDGTYTIESVMENYNPSVETGYLVPQTNREKDDYNKVIIGKITYPPVVQRFKFISTDYSSTDD